MRRLSDELYEFDVMVARAEADAEDRYRVRGEVSWVREAESFALADWERLVRSTRSESVGFDGRGNPTRVTTYVRTAFRTVALLRAVGRDVRLIVWGDDRESVSETVRAFLDAWPSASDAGVDVVTGNYV